MNPIKYLLFLPISLTISLASAQYNHWCGSDQHMQAALERDPSLAQTYDDLVRFSAELEAGETQRNGEPRIIPVVFHVIHTGGPENISKEQIEDQMRIINEDYRRLNADTVNTRDIFKPVATDALVEFRLAKKDPDGNCTEGINRVFSPLTNNADDAVKALSYWNSSRYLNVWVVNTIAASDDQPGIILGYAQFPNFGSAATDGVVVRADRIGSIGYAVPGDRGRTLTHEIGHWLGLLHTFQGGCGGGFFGENIEDTPPVAEANYSCSQNANSCTNDSPDLPDMIENYMDYANGSCMNTFTLGQKARMDGVLAGSRSQIHSAANLQFTGVNDPTPSNCAPKAMFYANSNLVCTGEQVTFTDDSYNGTVTTRSWEFPGGSPAASSAANPQVTYNTPGVYAVTLTAGNAQGSDTHSKTEYIRVLPATAEVQSYYLQEDFESADEQFFTLSDFGNRWERTNVGYTGDHSIFINNHSGNPAGSVDEFVLPSVDMRNINNPRLFFKLAYRTKSGQSDQLRVFISTNCGQTWSMRYNRSGSNLSSVSGNQGSPFTPSGQEQWKEEEVNLSNFASAEHMLVKFQSRSDEGNNIYVDDIRISGPLSIGDRAINAPDLTLAPNPATDFADLRMTTFTAEPTSIAVMDIMGREVASLHKGSLAPGDHNFRVDVSALGASGVYLVVVQTSSHREVRRLLVGK